MDCEYILRNDIHEQYLLKKLSPEEIQKYENHIEDCAACRAELENEQLLVGGIRQLGREDMKAELREQIEVLRSQKRAPDWTLLYKVAAVLFVGVFLPGLSYYYFNMEPLGISPIMESKLPGAGVQESADILMLKDEEKGTRLAQDNLQPVSDEEIPEIEKMLVSKSKKAAPKRVSENNSIAGQGKKVFAKSFAESESQVLAQPPPVALEKMVRAKQPDTIKPGALALTANQMVSMESVEVDESDLVTYNFVPFRQKQEEVLMSKRAARADAAFPTWIHQSDKGTILTHVRYESANADSQGINLLHYKVLKRSEYDLELNIKLINLDNPKSGTNFTFIMRDLNNLEIIRDDSLKYRLKLPETDCLVQPDTN